MPIPLQPRSTFSTRCQRVLLGATLVILLLPGHGEAQARARLEPDLAGAAERAGAAEQLEVVVFLRHRPFADLRDRAGARHRSRLETLAERSRALLRRARPAVPLSPAQEASLLETLRLTGRWTLSTAAETEARRELRMEIERLDRVMRDELQAALERAVGPQLDALEDRVAALGGRTVGRIWQQSALQIVIPAEKLDELARAPEILLLMRAVPGEPELDLQGGSLGADVGFWANGISGAGLDVGVLDTGVQQDHPHLNPTQWITNPNVGVNDSGGHGTAVAGILASDDVTVRGMAFGVETIIVGDGVFQALPTADWMVTTAAETPEAANLSVGFGVANGADYTSFDAFWDGWIDGNAVLLSKSAGNLGAGGTRITRPAPAYNLLAVADMNDKNSASRADDVIASTSSSGPTSGGRKKPDIAAPGSSTLTTWSHWAEKGQSEFINLSGTSAAAPHVSGAALLIAEMRALSEPMAEKAVLLNAADAWTDGGTPGDTTDDGPVDGSHWNPSYGWGYLDLGEAWLNGLDVFVDDFVAPEEAIVEGFALYKGFLFEHEKATLVWNRHVAYDGSKEPTLVEDLSDLDLYVYDESTGAELDASTSAIDNVEQIAVDAEADVVLKVKLAEPIDPDLSGESYALATEEGFVAAAPPSFGLSPASAQPSPGRTFSLAVEVTNDGDVVAFDNQVELDLPPGYQLVGGDHPQAIGDLAPAASAEASFVLQAVCNTDNADVGVESHSDSYGESFAAGTVASMQPLPIETLLENAPVTGSGVERTYEVPLPASGWVAVAVASPDSDHDLSIGSTQCVEAPYQSSQHTGIGTDFVILDAGSFPDSSHFAVVGKGTVGSYVIELDSEAPLALGDAKIVAFTGDEPLETYAFEPPAGEALELRVEVLNGDVDPSLFAIAPGRQSAARGNVDLAAAQAGAGEDESLIVLAAGGRYGIVLAKESGSGVVRLSATAGIFGDGFESGDTTAWSATSP